MALRSSLYVPWGGFFPTIVSRERRVRIGPTHDIYEVDTESGELYIYGHGSFVKTGTNMLASGSRYLFPAGQYHDTPHEGRLSATHFIKRPVITDRGPRVVCPHGSIPTDAFDPSRAPARELLVQLTADVLYKIGSGEVRDFYDRAAKEEA